MTISGKIVRITLAAAWLAFGLTGETYAQSQDQSAGSVGGKPALPAPAADAGQSGLAKPGDEIPTWKARWELARLLAYTKRYEESVGQYEKVLTEKPELWEARAELANVLFWAGKNERALKTLAEIPVDKIGPQARLLKADLLAAAKQYGQAEELYRAYLQAKPSDLAVRFKLAQALSWAQKYGPALQEYQTILQQRPQDKQVRRHYALVLSWSGQHEKAIQELEKSLAK